MVWRPRVNLDGSFARNHPEFGIVTKMARTGAYGEMQRFNPRTGKLGPVVSISGLENENVMLIARRDDADGRELFMRYLTGALARPAFKPWFEPPPPPSESDPRHYQRRQIGWALNPITGASVEMQEFEHSTPYANQFITSRRNIEGGMLQGWYRARLVYYGQPTPEIPGSELGDVVLEYDTLPASPTTQTPISERREIPQIASVSSPKPTRSSGSFSWLVMCGLALLIGALIFIGS